MNVGFKYVVAGFRACPSNAESALGAVCEGVNEWSGEHIPLLEKEGWMRGPKISRSNLSPRRRGGQTGEMIRPERFRRTDQPVCGNS